MPDFSLSTPDGDTRERMVCSTCGHVDYRNPKVVVGSVVSRPGQGVRCRRAIAPRRGFGAPPAG